MSDPDTQNPPLDSPDNPATEDPNGTPKENPSGRADAESDGDTASGGAPDDPDA